jgi:Fic family protein
MHYHQAIKCIWNLLCVKCGIAVAEEFKRVALFALFDDMEDYQQKLDEIKEERRMESKDKAPRREAANIILQEVREALAAERAKVSNNKNVTSNVLKTNVLKAENAEKRREEMLDLLRNNQNETYETLAAIFGCTPKTISRDIKRLEVSGRLRRIGEKSTGHWEVTE